MKERMDISRSILGFGALLLASLIWFGSDLTRELFKIPQLDEKHGTAVEEVLLKQIASPNSTQASFAFLENSPNGPWQHYCVLDYSSTDSAVEAYAKKDGLYSGKIWLKSFYDDEPYWSIVLLSESKYVQIPMLSGCISLQDIISHARRLDLLRSTLRSLVLAANAVMADSRYQEIPNSEK